MGAQFRCSHCLRGLGYYIYCPLRDMSTADCVFPCEVTLTPRDRVNGSKEGNGPDSKRRKHSDDRGGW